MVCLFVCVVGSLQANVIVATKARLPCPPRHWAAQMTALFNGD